jgi:hypothetical protein
MIDWVDSRGQPIRPALPARHASNHNWSSGSAPDGRNTANTLVFRLVSSMWTKLSMPDALI